MIVVPGSIVISKAGRDKGKVFISISKELINNYILIVDGNIRKIENPKKKKLKHVIITDSVIKKFVIKLKEGKPLQNAEILKEIRMYEEEM